MSYKKQIEELVNKGADNIKKKTITINDDRPIFAKEEIAYNLSAQSTDKENLFIGTNDLNTSMMKNIENETNDYIKKHDFKVLYKVTIKYKEDNQIPIGILIEAQSIDGDFNICRFCYNIEKYIKFDYADGTIIYNHDYLNKIKDKVESIREKIMSTTKQSKTKKLTLGQKRNFILNIARNECHCDKNCEKLNNVEPKYIQGTRTTEQAIIHNEFVFCDKCK